MNIPKFKLYRMGSDPEVLFVRPVDFDWIITPAYDVIGRDKKKTTASFIGTDSRPVIAEIRPSPSRNLKRHMYEIAFAVTSMSDYFDNSAKWKGLKMMAYPHLLGENLGGHIHASMFINDPLYIKMAKKGYTVGAGGTYVAPMTGFDANGRNRDLEIEVINGMNDNTLVSPNAWGKAVGWLLAPFEKWVQPWVPREQRNAHYGSEHSPDAVRLGVSKSPFASKDAYVHWEYRLPSTWLQHPWLAYAYLGLSKLVLLNMSRVFEYYLTEHEPKPKKKPNYDGNFLGGDGPPTQFTTLQVGDPAEAGEQLKRRLGRLLPGARVSKDLANLAQVIENCGAARAKWFERPVPVDVSAWRKLV